MFSEIRRSFRRQRPSRQTWLASPVAPIVNMSLRLITLALVVVIGIRLYRLTGSIILLWLIIAFSKDLSFILDVAGIIAFFTLGLKRLRQFLLGLKRLKLLLKRRGPHSEGLAGSVIYLRPFAADSLMGRVQGEGLAPTTEEILTEAVSDFGKLLALGHPEEHLPELGAERLYIRDGTWRATIVKWLSRANLVIISAGLTNNLQWEIEIAQKVVSPERLVLFLPTFLSEYKRFRNSLGPSFPKGIPEVTFGYSMEGLVGLICFDQDWVPRYIPLKLTGTDLYGPDGIITILRRALHPVYQALQVRPGTEPWWVSRWLAARHILTSLAERTGDRLTRPL